MRIETVCINERDFMFAVGGQLFHQAPNRQPRKAEIIMQKVRDSFRKDATNQNEIYTVSIPEKDIYNYIDKLLMDIPEFVELNLSQIEFENNVAVDASSRPKYSFITRHDKHDSESWKSDYIDLGAFIGNVRCTLLMGIKNDEDCFLCVKEKTDECKTCSVNPNFTCKYKSSREPKGQYTFNCKFDCKYHKCICCEECKKKDTCDAVCDGSSGTCGNKVME